MRGTVHVTVPLSFPAGTARGADGVHGEAISCGVLMPVLETNPFAILTFIAAPAVLTNASSVLALGTSNRFARNVDRSRALIKLLQDKDVNSDPQASLYRSHLPRIEHRAELLIRALSSFYFAIGS